MSVPDSFDSDLTRLQLGLAAILVLVGTVVSLPAVQSVLYGALVGTPSFLQWGAVSLLLVGVGVWRERPELFVAGVGVFVVLGLFVGPVVGGVYAHTDMATQVQGSATELDTLPNTSTENVRVLPRSVSDNYAQSSMQYPQYRLTGSDITYHDGSYAWSHGLAPDNFMVAWLGTQRGALYVDMTSTQKRVQVEEQSFTNGRGQLFFDSYQYRNVLNSPLKHHDWDTTFNARADGTSYIAHSTTVYDWKFRLAPIPQLYAIPRHGSVELMRPEGSISSLSPSEARSSPLLRGQNYYPYDVAMFKIESMQYVNGALNKWFWKEGVLAIADLPEAGNDWPLVVPTDGDEPELTYFVATEPTGSGNGVYEVWTIDSQTGSLGVQGYDESQIGPQKAVDFVERRPQVNRLSNADAVSPVPVVKGDTLYWHVKVVPQSRSGVVYTAFVNAESGDVTLVEGTEPIYGFLTEAEVEDVESDTAAQSGGTTVTVVVTNADGEIVGTRNVTVPEGGGVSVEVADRTANNSTAQAS